MRLTTQATYPVISLTIHPERAENICMGVIAQANIKMMEKISRQSVGEASSATGYNTLGSRDNQIVATAHAELLG